MMDIVGMSPWIGKMIFLVALAAIAAIRLPYGRRGRSIPVVRSRRGTREFILLAGTGIGFFLPLIWVATPRLDFADYPLQPIPLIIGASLLAIGLWLFRQSHLDLGTNWSFTLDVRKDHRLVTRGLYAAIRHPMYLALLIYSVGLCLALPNYLAGPSTFVAMILILFFRVGPEERMMMEEFGKDYEAYRTRTKRLIPGFW